MTRSEALEQANADVLLNGRCVGRTEYDGRYGTVLVITWHDPAGCEHHTNDLQEGPPMSGSWGIFDDGALLARFTGENAEHDASDATMTGEYPDDVEVAYINEPDAPAYEVGQAVEVRWTTPTGDDWRPTIIRKTYGPNAPVIEIEAHTPAGQPYMYRVHTGDVRPVGA